MKPLIVFILAYSLGIQNQVTLTGQYIGYKYIETRNRSFINKQMYFLQGKDSLYINIKLPIDTDNDIIDPGMLYGCYLKKDSIYMITLNKICLSNIPIEYNSYYRINTIVPKENNCSYFEEIKKDTKYLYRGNYGKYVDKNNELFEIVDIRPTDCCNFLH